MDRISTETELNWEFVEPLNKNALSDLEERLEIGFSDEFKDFINRSNYGFSQLRYFMVGNKSYMFKHVLNFNLESLFIDFMQSLKEWLEPEEIVFANDGYGGYYLWNTTTDVVLFLDTDNGSKKVLLNLNMFLKNWNQEVKMFSHKVFLEGCTNELRRICDYFVEEAMQDDLGQRLKSEVLEDMLKIAHDLENLEQETQYEMRKINEQIEEAKYLEKQIDMNFHSPSEIDRLMREAKEHEREAKRCYDEYLKDKND